MQCAAHFPGSRWQALSVIETAMIYRDAWSMPETARRLAQRAVEDAQALGEPEIAARAAAVLETVSPDGVNAGAPEPAPTRRRVSTRSSRRR